MNTMNTDNPSRASHKITLVVFGRYTFGKLKGTVNKSIMHKVELFTGITRDGIPESVSDRVKRFVEEASGGFGIVEAPAYQISGVEIA